MDPLEADDPRALGPYRIIARLGAGGMGRVYLARSAGGRAVALKVVRPELAGDASFRSRFGREVDAARAVGGAWTAPVVDADLGADVPWLATAFVLGHPLDDAVARFGPLPEESLRALGTGLAEALVSVHAAGLVHRDLKPSNVLMAGDGPRVIDFGIARAVDGDTGAGGALTQTGLVIGSPGYMSPEQASGERVGPASDVFSMGAVLAFAATGRGPFGEGSTAGQLYQVVHGKPDLTGVPEALDPVIRACLAKDPADRPAPASLVGEGGLAALLAEAHGAWLPAPLASSVAAYAASVMDMEAPGGPEAYVKTGDRTAVDAPADPPAATGPSRRGLLLGAGAGVVVLGGGAAAYVATRGGAPKRKPGEPPKADWTTTVPTPASGTFPTAANGRVLLYAGRNVLALNADSHRRAWSRPGLAEPGGAPVVCGDSVVARHGHGLAVYSLDSGALRRTVRVSLNHLLASDGTLVYGVAGGGTRLVAVDPDTGRTSWSRTMPGPAGENPSADVSGEHLVYANGAASGRSFVTARRTDNGGEEWTATAGCNAPRPLVAGAAALFRTGTGGGEPTGLRAVRLSDGGGGHDIVPKGAFQSVAVPAVSGSTVYVAADTKLLAVSLKGSSGAGGQRWAVDLDGAFTGSATVLAGNGLVYTAGSASTGIQARRVSDGAVQWTLTTRSQDSSSGTWHPALAGKVLYATLDATALRSPAV